MTSDNEIGRKLKKIRKVLNLKQDEFAEPLGLSQGGYSDIERGKNGLSPKVKLMLIKVYNINIDYLEKDEGQMFVVSPNEQLEEEENENEDNQGFYIDSNSKLIELLKAEVNRLKSEKTLFLQLIESKDHLIKTLETQLKKFHEEK